MLEAYSSVFDFPIQLQTRILRVWVLDLLSSYTYNLGACYLLVIEVFYSAHINADI